MRAILSLYVYTSKYVRSIGGISEYLCMLFVSGPTLANSIDCGCLSDCVYHVPGCWASDESRITICWLIGEC